MSSSIADIPRCQHVKVNGLQCGSPALRHKRFCYFHHAWREVSSPSSRAQARAHRNGEAAGTSIPNLPPLEDANSIQMALMQVVRLMLARQIDGKLAGLLLYALQTATSNLKQLTLEPDWKSVIVNPKAVRYSPLDTRTPQELARENEPGFFLTQNNPNAGESAGKKDEKQRPCATLAAAFSPTGYSSHPLPTSPEQWDELKEKDTTSWLLAMASLTFPRETWEKFCADPDQWQEEEPQEEPVKQ
jgi:hypothetical protein